MGLNAQEPETGRRSAGFLTFGSICPRRPLVSVGGGRAVKAAQPILLELTNSATDGGIHSIWGRFLVLFVSSFSAQSLDTLL